jgi:hypothetical protein
MSKRTARETRRIISQIESEQSHNGHDVPQVAVWIGRGQSTVWAWIRAGMVPYRRVDRQIRIPGDWVIRYLRGEVQEPKRGRPAKPE